MADTKQIDWGDGSGEKITVTASSFVGNKGLQIQSPENVKVTPRSKTIVLKSKTDPTKVARINVTQQKAVYTYDFTLTASVPTIAAKGGSSIISAQLKTYRNGNLIETKAVTPVLSGTGTGFSISRTTVSASNRTTVVGTERSITVTGKFSGTFDGQEVSATVVVKQEANAVVSTVKTVDIRLASGAGSSSSNPIPASGGRIQYNATGNTRTTYTSGSYKDEGFTPTISGSAEGFTVDQPSESAWYITAANRGTVVGDTRSVVVTASETGATSKSVTVYQQANSLTWNNPVITYAYSDIAASGGTVTPSLSITQSGSYTSGSTASNTTIGSKSFSGTGVNTSTGAYSASSLGTTVKTRTKLSTGTVSVTANGKSASKSADIYQAENKIKRYNYGSWNITISANPAIIAYGGGKSIVSASCTRSKTPVYSSGATGPAGSESATPTLSGSATGFTLSGTTVTASANSWAATRSITVTASYSGATSKSVTVTQAAAPASISLNKATIAFPQRSSSNTVQVTCNSDWSVNSNAEFAIPETLQIKYNPSTDMVEVVDQPSQIIKKVQESDDYVLAFVRLGSCQEPNNHTPTKTISRSDIAAAKNSGGFNTKMNEWLVSQAQNKSYHRIVARNWFYNGNATQQIQAGTGVFRNSGMASLMPSDTLISKPGKALGLRNVGLKIPKSLRFLLVEVWKFYKLTSFINNIEVETNNKTGRIQFTVTEFSNVADSRARSPKESFMRCQSQIGPVGYILYKKASTTEYLDIRGWKEVSNFALARTLSDDEAKVKSIGNVEIVVIKFKYGED
jgi:hypothetical protein